MKRLLLVFLLVGTAMGTVLAQRNISGTITDQETGDPLIGATILVKGTTIGTVSDLDGQYNINVPDGRNTLQFSYTGYAPQETEIGASSIVDVQLGSDIAQLSEVLVVGYNSVKRSDLTSAVSVVDGEQLTAQPIGGIDNLLQGASTGLQVVGQNGRPGGAAFIRIRGVGSVNASNEPLFIIDGVQVTQSDYNALNPNDISKVTVLKDAASTAIYGSRASNGVILITTKKGRRDRKPQISYNFQYGEKQQTDDGMTLMNGNQKLDYEVALGIRSEESAQALRDKLGFLETDWEDVLTRKGLVRTHDLSIAGGSDRANYHFSLGYYGERGITVGSDFERLTGRFNMDFDVTDWLKVGNTFSLSRTDDNELRDVYNVQNPFVAVYTYNPYETEFVLDDNGEQVLDTNGNPVYNRTQQGFSISEALVNNPENKKRANAIGSIYLQATILPKLTFKSQVGGNYQIYRRETYIKPGSILDGYIGDPNAPGIKTDNGSDRFLYNWFNTLSYNFKLGSQHEFNTMVGTEFYMRDLQAYQINGKGFPSANFSTQDNAAEITGGNTSRTQWSLWSQFGEIRYNYDSRYLASFSLRRDGSSRFGASNKYGVFYAGSLAWNLARETFLADSGFDQLKLRLSAGTSGNEPGITNLYWQGNYNFISYNDLTASKPNQLSNATLKWEENFNYSIGLDFGVFNNRLSGSVDYYQRRTSDLLFPEPLSRTTGWTSRLANIGEMLNSGVEFELVGEVVRTPGFNVSLFANFTTNKNEIINLKNGGEDIIDPNSGISLLREGLPVNNFYLNRYAGVDPTNGDALYLDVDGNVTNAYRTSDAVALDGKAPQPKFFGSFGTNVSVKGFDLAVNFYYAGGHYTYNFNENAVLSDGARGRSQHDVRALNYWKNPGDVNVLPRPDINNNVNTSDRFLQKADYLRLRNVNLGYSLPGNVIEKVGFQQVRFFVQGTNLLTFAPHYTGDPEVGVGSVENTYVIPGEISFFNYPQTMGWTMGANLIF